MKKTNDVEIPLYLWKVAEAPSGGKELSLWKLSLYNALKNGFISSEIQTGTLKQKDLNNIEKYLLNTNHYLFPDLYQKYEELIREKKSLEELNNKKIIAAFRRYDFNEQQIDIDVNVGDKFFYDKELNVFRNEKGQTFLNASDASSALKRLEQNIEDLRYEKEVKPDTPFYVSWKSGKYVFLEAPVKSNHVINYINSYQKKIDELSLYIKNKPDEDIRKEEAEFFARVKLDDKIKKELAKYRAEVRREESGITIEEQKMILSEKRRQKAEEKKIKREQERERYLTDNNIPRTIAEFKNRKNVTACSDVVKGDVVLFSEAVFSGDYRDAKYEGERQILGLIENESYGSLKGQHSFTIYVLDSEGIQPIDSGELIRRMGRNLYKDCKTIQYASQSVRDEKHERANEAKNAKYWQWIYEAEMEGKMFKLEKVPISFLKENWESIKAGYPNVASRFNFNTFEHGGITMRQNGHLSLGSSKEYPGITKNVMEHDSIAVCFNCGNKFSYQKSKENVIWECPVCRIRGKMFK
jgi:hypothetical protein